jgi:hypothetical protein
MKINKLQDVDWCITKTSYVDDVAYQLYINYMFDSYGLTTKPGPQREFIYNKNSIRNLPYRFYKEAEKIIRKEKLEKICSKSEIK